MSSSIENINLIIGAGVIYKNNFYFSEFQTNGFYKMDLETLEIEFLKVFREEEESYILYRDAYLYGHDMWLMPWRASYIVKVDLITFEMFYFEIPYKEKNIMYKKPLSTTGLILERYVYVILKEENKILVLDMKESKIIPYYDIYENEKEVVEYIEVDKNKLILYFEGEKKMKILESVMNKKEGYIYDIKEEKNKKVKINEIIFNNKLWILPEKEQKESKLYSKDLKTGEIRFWDERDGISPNWSRVGMRKISYQGKLLITTAGYLNIFDAELNKFRNYRLWINKKKLYMELEQEFSENQNILNCFKGNKDYILEEYISLNGFIRGLPKGNSKKSNPKEIGKHIFEVIKND